jgi:hypothetical protein
MKEEEVTPMTYDKPEILVLGDANRAIQNACTASQSSKWGLSADGSGIGCLPGNNNVAGSDHIDE